MYCQSCGKVIRQIEEVVLRRDYYWHILCYKEDSFPSNGKIIPDTLFPSASEEEAES